MIENPFKRLRLAHSLTQQAIAARAQCSKHLVIRLEQGCFPTPVPLLLDFFVEEFGLSSSDEDMLVAEYHDFQTAQRRSNPLILGPLPIFPVGIHPLKFWRTHDANNIINLTQLSKALCLSQSTLYRFEEKSSLQGIVPTHLLDALKENGYSDEALEVFVLAYDAYREHIRKEVSINVSFITSRPDGRLPEPRESEERVSPESGSTRLRNAQ